MYFNDFLYFTVFLGFSRLLIDFFLHFVFSLQTETHLAEVEPI